MTPVQHGANLSGFAPVSFRPGLQAHAVTFVAGFAPAFPPKNP